MKKTEEQTPKIIIPSEVEATEKIATSDYSTDASTGEVAAQEPDDSIESLRDRVEKLTESLARAKAENQNMQRRTANEMAEVIRFGHAGLLKSILSVLDDFDRALAAEDVAEHNSNALLEGIKLVHTNLMQALTGHGLQVIDALHKPFDPALHEAMLQQPSDDHPPNTVIEQLAQGYHLHDRVLRPAKVIVSKQPDEAVDRQED